MKLLLSRRILSLIGSLLPVYVFGQVDLFPVGLSICIPANGINTTVGAGIDIGGMRQRQPFYYFGYNANFVLSSESRNINIVGNLTSGESIESDLTMVTFAIINRFDLTPNSTIKFFMDVEIGPRIAVFKAIHKGNFLIYLPTEESIYEKTSVGIGTMLLANVYYPIDKLSRFALQFKTGMEAGTGVKYIELRSIQYTNGSFIKGPVKSSSASFWILGVDFVYRIQRD